RRANLPTFARWAPAGRHVRHGVTDLKVGPPWNTSVGIVRRANLPTFARWAPAGRQVRHALSDLKVGAPWSYGGRTFRFAMCGSYRQGQRQGRRDRGASRAPRRSVHRRSTWRRRLPAVRGSALVAARGTGHGRATVRSGPG